MYYVNIVMLFGESHCSTQKDALSLWYEHYVNANADIICYLQNFTIFPNIYIDTSMKFLVPEGDMKQGPY